MSPSCVTPQLQGGFVQRSPSPWEGREEQPHLPQASSALPTRGFAQLFPPVHRLHPSSSGPPKEQPGWVLGVFLPVEGLQSLA